MRLEVFIKNLLLGISFYAALFILLFLYLIFSNRLDLFSEKSFLNWDAQHYFFIKENGYQDFKVAFFPLFPFLWKISHLSPIGISILNGLLFIFSFAAFSSLFKIKDNPYIFLLLSFPGAIFMFLPYSEAVFFFSSVILLIGFHKKNEELIFLGLILCSVSRPVASIFIPAIFITEYLLNDNKRTFLVNSVKYSLAVGGGLFLSLAVHFYYTGKWFSFFEAQQGWGNYFRIPEFPLNSWAGGNIVRLDGTALLIGLIAAVGVVILLKQKLKHNILPESKALAFSMLYLAGIALFVLFFRGGWLFSLNRFVFSTPFFFICCWFFLQNIRLTWKQLLICFFALTLYWFLFKSFVHIQTILKYEALTIYLLLFMLISHKNKIFSNFAFTVCFAGNIFLLLYFYHLFLNGGWVG